MVWAEQGSAIAERHSTDAKTRMFVIHQPGKHDDKRNARQSFTHRQNYFSGTAARGLPAQASLA
jgi:hypothetical protein